MRIPVVPFADEHIEPACQLLARRHRRMQETEPLLVTDFSNPDSWLPLLTATRSGSRNGGLAAIADRNYAGHLLWDYSDTPVESIFSAFAPEDSVEASLDGFAVDPERPGAARALYASASRQWNADRRGTQELTAAAADSEVLDELYGLGFGRAYSVAVREPSVTNSAAQQPDITFREAIPGDEIEVRRLAENLWRSYAESPIHMPFIPESMPELYARADRYISDPATPVWLAERGGRAEALEVFLTPESDDWFLGPQLTPEGAIYLFWASTAPEARGHGVHTALLNHTSNWAQQEGFATILLHFLAASFASEYWQRLGFRPVVHGLSRSIDQRALPVR